MGRELGVEKEVKRYAVKLAHLQMDLVCFSHLRWKFVYQRPQHLMSRFVRNHRVFFVEEPVIDPGPNRLVIDQDESGVWVVAPHLAKVDSVEETRSAHVSLIDQLLVEFRIQHYIGWYYTPMALGFTRHLQPSLVVYDCMDELSAFNGAPKKLREYEAELLKRADLVFTGGMSLYEAKQDQHANIYAFPSSIDRSHFARARVAAGNPPDQAGIPHPRLGFFGVIDERMDLELIAGVADARPDWHLIMIGPFTKIDEACLPQRRNIHFLGMKAYKDLPAYLSGWDVAILPFAQNESTRFISPTKTPEYLAGGKPVVSTPIRDVIRPYGELGLVKIAEGVAEFVRGVESFLDADKNKSEWLAKVDEHLASSSWDKTWEDMERLIQAEAGKMTAGKTTTDDRPPTTDKTTVEKMTSECNDLVGDRSQLQLSVTGLVEQAPATKRNNTHPGGKNNRSNGGSKWFDYLIVGAGYAGSVLAERLASGAGKKVLVIDRRPHIGGNAYDYYNEDGLLIHKYGPHIFHTNSQEVFAYLSRFTEWRPYEHRVLASVEGQLLPIPINLDTVNRLYGLNLSSFELGKFFESLAEPVEQVRTSEDVVISKIGRDLYEKFFRNYTRKQWGLDPSELDATVTSRVPIRLNRDDRYFSDKFQSMPLHGYTRMFENMLDHPNIKIMLNCDYRDIAGYIHYREMVYTGPVDEYFNYCYGKLPYRSLQFKFETINQPWRQPVAVVNYPNEHVYTRSTEFKHLTGQENAKTCLVYEYPCAEGDPYYPVPRPENAEIYKKYKARAEATRGVYFAGRLATYRYYNMDQVTAQALTLYAKITGQRRTEAIQAYNRNRFMIDIPCSLLTMGEDG